MHVSQCITARWNTCLIYGMRRSLLCPLSHPIFLSLTGEKQCKEAVEDSLYLRTQAKYTNSTYTCNEPRTESRRA